MTLAFGLRRKEEGEMGHGLGRSKHPQGGSLTSSPRAEPAVWEGHWGVLKGMGGLGTGGQYAPP